MKTPTAAFSVCVLSVFLQPAVGEVLHVNAGLASGGNHGASWSDAFQGPTGLQAALTAAVAGDEIWVAQGTYRTGEAGVNPLVSFQLKDGVAVLGGFAGGETSSTQRDPASRVCVLTGDVLGDDLTSPNTGRWENAYHVVRATAVGSATVLDGFTVEGGYARSRPGGLFPDVSRGSGVLLESAASPVIRGCRFTRNSVQGMGAGIVAQGGTPVIEWCVFEQNMAPVGPGIAVSFGAQATIRGCRFVDTASATMNSVRGAGVSVGVNGGVTPGLSPAAAVIEDCRFSISLNPAHAGSGLGVYIGAGEADIRRCTFIRNSSAGSGGAITCDATARVDRCVFIGNEGTADGGAAIYGHGGNISIANSRFCGNDRAGFSSVTMIHAGPGTANPGSITLANCTFFDNGNTNASHRVFQPINSTISVRNCIVWGNRSSLGTASALGQTLSGGTLQIDRCNIEAYSGAFGGTSTISADPLFENAAGIDGLTGTEDDDLRLNAGSPCIDRGDNAHLPSGIDFDLSGSARRRDDPATADTGPGPAPVVDLGAFEFVPPCPGDLNGDGAVNTADLALMLGVFGTAATPGQPADIDGSGFIDTADLALFLGVFGLGCP